MAVEVVTPQEFLGDVIGDLSKRRGRVEGQEPRGNALAVKASVPLSRCSGTRRTCVPTPRDAPRYSMQFDRYEEVPNNLATTIVEGRTGEPVGATA
jgi:elongation factor G